MVEDLKNEIEKKLKREGNKQKKAIREQEKWRKRFEEVGRGAIELYRKEVRETRPLAEAKLKEVILPWWRDFQDQGLYDLAMKYVSKHHSLRITNSVLYFWPNKVLEHFRDDSHKPFDLDAEFLVKNHPSILTTKEEEFFKSSQRYLNKFWWAYFDLENWGSFSGIKIGRWPLLGGGFGFAMTTRSYDIKTTLENDSVLNSIHPAVFLGLADQIESGQVWKVLNESLQNNDYGRVISSDEREVRNQRDWALYHDFIKKRSEGMKYLVPERRLGK